VGLYTQLKYRSSQRRCKIQVKTLASNVINFLSRENISYWTGLASSGGILPADTEDLIRNQERTFVSIQGSGEYDSSYGSSWSSSYDTGTTSYDNSGYDTGGYSNTGSYGNSYVIR
jgi:hypothetical protein